MRARAGLLEHLNAPWVSCLKPGDNVRAQELLKGGGVEAFAGGDEKLGYTSAHQSQKIKTHNFTWCLCVRAYAHLFIHIMHMKVNEVSGVGGG